MTHSFVPLNAPWMILPYTEEDRVRVEGIMREVVELAAVGLPYRDLLESMPFIGRIFILRGVSALKDQSMPALISIFFARHYHTQESWNDTQNLRDVITSMYRDLVAQRPEAAIVGYTVWQAQHFVLSMHIASDIADMDDGSTSEG